MPVFWDMVLPDVVMLSPLQRISVFRKRCHRQNGRSGNQKALFLRIHGRGLGSSCPERLICRCIHTAGIGTCHAAGFLRSNAGCRGFTGPAPPPLLIRVLTGFQRFDIQMGRTRESLPKGSIQLLAPIVIQESAQCQVREPLGVHPGFGVIMVWRRNHAGGGGTCLRALRNAQGRHMACPYRGG